MSVTSSGRSSTSSTIRCTSGLLRSMEWTICFMIVVLPAFGGETMRPRWPFPIGETRSTMRPVRLLGSPGISRRSFSSGNRGVRSSKRGRVLAAAVGEGGVEAPVAAPPPAAPAAALAVALPGLGLGALGPGAWLTARAGALVVALGGDRAGAATVAAGAVRPQRRGLGLDRRGLGGGGGGLGRSAEGEPLRFGRGRLGGGRRGGLGRRPRSGLGGRAPAPVGLRRLGRRGRRLGRLGVGGLLAGGPLLGLLPGRLGDRRPAGRFVEDRLDEVRLAEAGRPPDAHGGRDLVQLVTVAQPELGPFGGELPRSGHRSCVLLADASKIRWDGRLRSSTGSCGPGRGPACPLRDGMPSIARLTTSSMTWASVASRL